MKRNIKNIFAAVAALVSFAGCEEPSAENEVTFPESRTIEVEAGTTEVLSFTAEAQWSLTSDRSWCKFDDEGVVVQTISGPAGEAAVTLTVSADAQDFDAAEAKIDMTMSGKTQTICIVTRPGIKREVKMYVKKSGGESTPAEIIEFGYDDIEARKIPSIGFTANFNWKVKRLPEGMTLSQSLTGEPGEELTDDKMASIVLEKAKMASDFEDAIVISDLEGNNEFSFPVKFTGISAEKVLIEGGPANKKIVFTYDGYLYINDAGGNKPSDEKEIGFSVMTRDMENQIVILEVINKEYKVLGDDSWVKVSGPDAEGNTIIAVEKSESLTKRTAFVMCFHKSVDIATIVWSKYIHNSGNLLAEGKKHGFQITQDAFVPKGGYKAQWGLSLADVSGKLVPFGECPEFDGKNLADIFPGAPEGNTYVFEVTSADLKGALKFVPKGYPSNLTPIGLSKKVEYIGTLPADSEQKKFVEHSLYYPGDAPSLAVTLSMLDQSLKYVFAILTYESEEAMNGGGEAFGALVFVFNKDAESAPGPEA